MGNDVVANCGALSTEKKTARHVLFWMVGLVLLLGASPAHAQANREEIPDELKPWVPWVLSELGQRACTNVHGAHQCVWPGRLSLDLRSDGGTFEQQVVVGAQATHVLPGGDQAWPQKVSVDGREHPVLTRGNRAVVDLAAGVHQVKGAFRWSQLPETLPIGQDAAFVTLRVSGNEIPLVKRESGKLWLKDFQNANGDSSEPEQVSLSVFRHIQDSIPLRVRTRIVLQVAGKARELELANPLLQGTAPLSVEGDLALAFERDGTLRVQLMPGTHEITLTARTVQSVDELSNQKRPAPWPEREIWVWQPDGRLRAVELSGASGIDASRTELPSEWKQHSAFAVGQDDTLSFQTTRRGQEQLPPNTIHLRREFWLDESAKAFTVRDHLSGEMRQAWRLDLLRGELGQVSVHGQNQVVTQSSQGRGVEIRDGSLDISAVSRISRKKSIDAVGWSEDVDSLSATVHLPPGWEVFAAWGVDNAGLTWISRWDLFDVFFVLVLCAAMFKLTGLGGAIVTAAALVLCHEQREAPFYIWVLPVVLVGLVRALSAGRFRKFLRGALAVAGVLITIQLVGFSVAQVRSALYPHLSGRYLEGETEGVVDPAPMEASPSTLPSKEDALMETEEESKADSSAIAQAEQESQPGKGAGGPAAPNESKFEKPLTTRKKNVAAIGRYGIGGLGLSGSSLNRNAQKQLAPDAIVQTGPGIPQATGSSWDLNWSGPVVRGHQMRLMLISPTMMRLLTLVRLLACFALVGLFVRLVRAPKNTQPRDPGASSSTRTAVAAVAFALILAGPSNAHADQPTDERLQQLKQRLTKPPSCAPQCVSVSLLSVDVSEQISIRAEVHAAARAAYKLPGPAKALISPELRLNSKPAQALRLENDGAYYLRLDPGVHNIELRARLAGDRATLDIGSPPHQVTVSAEGWVVTGVDDEGRVPGGTITIQRSLKEESDKSGDSPPQKRQVAVPAYFSVTRSLSLGVTAQMTTRIERRSDVATPEIFELTLLPQERVTTPGVATSSKAASVVFPREVTVREITSTLKLPPNDAPLELTLSAADIRINSTVWKLQCGVVWHCTPRGLAATRHMEEGRSLWTFHPRSGETLTLRANKPQAAPGASLTVQAATLKLTPGIRSGRGQLRLSLRTSRSAIHTLSIPRSADLETVQVNGKKQAVKAEDGRVNVSLLPGKSEVVVTWKEPKGIASLFSSPDVNAGASGVNFRTSVEVPKERWLLFARGPAQGPAILFWGYLVLVFLSAGLLSRAPRTKLKFYQWVLLGLGLTQVPAAVALMVVGWFFAVAYRDKWKGKRWWHDNIFQLMLIGYTILFICFLTGAVYEGLVSSPDMEVSGAGSSNSLLTWYVDRSQGPLPSVGVLSVSLWVWRGFMLFWALWLAISVVNWLRWAWLEITCGGFWKSKPEAVQTPTGPATHPPPRPETKSPERKESAGGGARTDYDAEGSPSSKALSDSDDEEQP